MTRVTALFDTAEAAADSTRALTAAGLAASAIDVLSSVPLDHVELDVAEPASHLHWLALGGGLTGFVAGVCAAWGLGHAWPLYVGGRSLVSGWSTGVIAYETTMLGAIVATVVGLLVEGRLLRRPEPAPPEIYDGAVAVSVSCDDEEMEARARDALTGAGGAL